MRIVTPYRKLRQALIYGQENLRAVGSQQQIRQDRNDVVEVEVQGKLLPAASLKMTGLGSSFRRKIMCSDNATRREVLMTSLLLPLEVGGIASAAPVAAAQLPQGKILVAYFSRSGNTRVIAGQVSRALRADLFEINSATPYPDGYFETVEQAKQESDRGYEPPLNSEVADVASYTTVFLGFPIWGMTAPPVIRSFLAAHNLSGKALIPLVTHGGYGLGDSLAVVAKHTPRTQLVEGFSMLAPQERQTIERVTDWLDGLKVTR
jgi:flavodoxin